MDFKRFSFLFVITCGFFIPLFPEEFLLPLTSKQGIFKVVQNGFLYYELKADYVDIKLYDENFILRRGKKITQKIPPKSPFSIHCFNNCSSFMFQFYRKNIEKYPPWLNVISVANFDSEIATKEQVFSGSNFVIPYKNGLLSFGSSQKSNLTYEFFKKYDTKLNFLKDYRLKKKISQNNFNHLEEKDVLMSGSENKIFLISSKPLIDNKPLKKGSLLLYVADFYGQFQYLGQISDLVKNSFETGQVNIIEEKFTNLFAGSVFVRNSEILLIHILYERVISSNDVRRFPQSYLFYLACRPVDFQCKVFNEDQDLAYSRSIGILNGSLYSEKIMNDSIAIRKTNLSVFLKGF